MLTSLRRTALVALSLAPAACFNPDDAEGETDVAASSGTGGSSDSADPVATDATPPGPTTGGEPGTGSQTSGEPTGDIETSSADTSTGEPDPFCGDGVIDAELQEICDDGENNGPGQACNANCELNVCGDGDPGPAEGCDEGNANALALGACAPDCSGVIEERHITFGNALPNGNFGTDPVAYADSTCPDGYAAMFSFASVRRASLTPWVGDGQNDWVLQPYTAYTNDDGEIVWITDGTALLGVRAGAPMPLENPVEDMVCGMTCPILDTITGMADDWTNLGDNICIGWSSASSGATATYGRGTGVEDFLELNTRSCGANWFGLYFMCVEQ
ncbi:MAG: DUF1554 domain-containing protein [Myxococcota bacterium]